MTRDRNYLRMMHDCELTRYAADNVRTELEFVLLERLERLVDIDDELEDARGIIKELQAEIDALDDEVTAMEAQIDAIARTDK